MRLDLRFELEKKDDSKYLADDLNIFLDVIVFDYKGKEYRLSNEGDMSYSFFTNCNICPSTKEFMNAHKLYCDVSAKLMLFLDEDDETIDDRKLSFRHIVDSLDKENRRLTDFKLTEVLATLVYEDSEINDKFNIKVTRFRIEDYDASEKYFEVWCKDLMKPNIY